MNIKTVFTIFFLTLLTNGISHSDEIYLKNDDRITGRITSETDTSIVLDTEAMGKLTIQKGQIARTQKDKKLQSTAPLTGQKAEEEKKEEYPWKKYFSMGYTANRGNTKNQDLNIQAMIKRIRKHIDEILFKGYINYSSSDKKMDGQEWYTLGRYAYSFGKAKKWYNFYKAEADHDKFSDVNYRIVPSAGLGYWFSDTDMWQLLLECGIGYEYVIYTNETPTKREIVLVPRLFVRKKLFKNITGSEDITFYNPIDNFGDCRLHSETIFHNPINECWATKLMFICDYNLAPAEDAGKNDLEIIASLEYSF